MKPNEEKEATPHVPGSGMYRADGWEPPDRRHLPARQKKSSRSGCFYLFDGLQFEINLIALIAYGFKSRDDFESVPV